MELDQINISDIENQQSLVTSQIQTPTQGHISVIDTTTEIPSQDKEQEIRKRVSDDLQISVIWSEYDFYIEKQNGERTKVNITEIFKYPHEMTGRLYIQQDFKEKLNGSDKYILKCHHCEEEFSYYPSSSSNKKAIDHITDRHHE